MKRLRNLWPQLITFDNLWQAWRQARRGKSRSAGAVAFELALERLRPHPRKAQVSDRMMIIDIKCIYMTR